MNETRSGRLWDRLGRLAYGADYNPEQWDEQTWARDIELMQRARVNLVSLAIFGWAALEPEPERYEFGWLDTVMGMLGDAGISVCLATATASPPAWLSVDHPEILPVDGNGRTLWHGSRQHFCPSSPVFRAHAGRLVRALAERYRDHPALAAWHIGNEYGCHVSRCWCDVSAADFRAWLQRRHGDLDGLNRAWSTSFWSQRYSRWEEVLPPRATPTFPNPAQQLDFFQFSSDALRACLEAEVAIVSEVTPDVPVTTNFLGAWEPVDAFSWTDYEDFISHDSYPDPFDPEAAVGAAMVFDLMRGAGGGARWLLLEQAPSAVNWREVNTPKRPGVYRLWSWQAIAHGSAGALSFQWRASRGGAEKFHSAFVPHAGEDTDTYRGVEALGHELASVPEVAASVPEPAPVAVMMDWRSRWALGLPSRPSERLELMELVGRWYEPLWRETAGVEVVGPGADLGRYRVVLVPNLYLVSEATAAALARFVHDGGHLVVGFFSGIADEHDVVWPGAYPGALRDLLGVTVDRFEPLHEGESVGLELASGVTGTGELWSEALQPDDAEVLATFSGGVLDGRPAVTRARRGEGSARYLATLPDAVTLRALLGEALADAGVQGVLASPCPGIEATLRGTDDEQLLFVLNHGAAAAEVGLDEGWRSLVGPPPTDNKVILDAQDVVVLRRPRPA
jgi:beta-galactosidase